MQECKHNYEVQFSIWCGALYKCTKCEAMLYLKRKYTSFLFIIGFVGWLVPYLFLPSILPEWVRVLLISGIYLLFIVMVNYIFFLWLKTLNKTRQAKYFQ